MAYLIQSATLVAWGLLRKHWGRTGLVALALGLGVVRLFPVLTVMQFVSLTHEVATEATFYANAEVRFRFRRHGKDFSCWGRYGDVRVDPPNHHIPGARATIELTSPCEGDPTADVLSNVQPRFGMIYSVFMREATMYWYKQAYPSEKPRVAAPAVPLEGEEGPDAEGELPETPPWAERFDTIAMRLDLLYLAGVTM